MNLPQVHQQAGAGINRLNHAKLRCKLSRQLALLGRGQTYEKFPSFDVMLGKCVMKPAGRQNPQLYGSVEGRL